MNIPSKGIWVGLFAHIDSVTRGTLDLLLELKKMGIKEHGKEHFVSEAKFRKINGLVEMREWRVGGNAGNAALFLGNLGVECNLSAPTRPKMLMEFFDGLPVFVWGLRRKAAKMSGKNDPAYEHLVIELFPPLSESGRTIISWDPMTKEGQLDAGFWENMDKGIFLLSGLHLIEKRKKINEIIDRLREKKMKVYLETGEPTRNMKYAFDRLLDEKLVHHIGLNEKEAEALFELRPHELVDASKDLEFGVTIHTPDFVTSTKTPMLRNMVDAIQAWAMGDLRHYKQVTSMPLKRVANGETPTRSLPFIEVLTGLGDATAALDAIRVFDPKRMEKITRVLPFYGSDKFPSKL